ncbi:DUF1801 domain-containing protein [Foetidibacter luteolus]|uniref:DUF1801 domain-containing protein n=1 Tax=Foetidibacter luteolus TaxID=2608880 RepID=UPI00129A3183|nr:DUF1801 domain-containing protein [Foetidibacter luteolus]
MLSALDNFFLQKNEPEKSCLQALRQIILQYNAGITEHWKYGLPFYYYNGKMFCYLWIHKKYKQPYIGICQSTHIEHPQLLIEKRAKMKILLVNPEEDIPVDTIALVFRQSLSIFK